MNHKPQASLLFHASQWVGKGSVEGPRPGNRQNSWKFNGTQSGSPPNNRGPSEAQVVGVDNPTQNDSNLYRNWHNFYPSDPLKFSRLLPSRMGFLSIALCQTRRNPQHLVNRSMGEKKWCCDRNSVMSTHCTIPKSLFSPINERRKIEGWHSTARRLSAGVTIIFQTDCWGFHVKFQASVSNRTWKNYLLRA